MGQPLTGTEVQATYEALLKTPNNTTLVPGNTEVITDGAGNESALHLGIDQVKLKGEYVQIESQSGQSGIVADAGTPSSAEINYYGTHSFQSATVEGLPFQTDYQISAEDNGFGATIDITAYPSESVTSSVQLLAGNNVTIDTTGNVMTINAAGGAAGLVAGTGTSSMKSADSLTTNPATASGSNSIALGSGAVAENESSIAIGKDAKATAPYSIAIGTVNNTYPDGVAPYVSIQTTTIDMAFRENSVAIGNVAYPAYNGIAIGNDAAHTGGGYYRSVVIGNTARANGDDDVTIGNNSGGYGNGAAKITIGKNVNNFAEKSILIGSSLDNADDTRIKSILIGNSVKGAQYAIVIGNDSTEYASADSIQIGNGGHRTLSNYGINLGYNNDLLSYADNMIVIGQNNTADNLAGAAIIGNNITAVRANTLHVNGLNVGTVNEYADNAAAVSAGLPIGQVYRTGDLLKVVHA